MPHKISEKYFLFPRFSIKTSFSMLFKANLSEIHIFVKLLFGASAKCPPSPSPSPQCSVEWGSTGSFYPLAVGLVMVLKQ
jgi:hypothetical protein